MACGAYPPTRRMWVYSSVAIIALAALFYGLQGVGPQHIISMASFMAAAW